MKNLTQLITLLTTPNPEMINVFLIPVYFLDAFVSMLLFTTLLDFKANKKQMKMYVIFSIICITCKFIKSSFIGSMVSITASFISIYFIFKQGFLKTFLATILPSLVMTPVETVVIAILKNFISVDAIVNIPIYRIFSMLCIYSICFIIYMLAKKFNINIRILSNMKKLTKNVVSLNILFAFITVAIQLYLIYYYSAVLPGYVLLLSTISLLAYIFISFYNLSNTTKLEVTTRDLDNLKLYNKTLDLLQDSLRTFKHDFSNIVQGIGGYIYNKDIEGLKQYYSELLEDCNKVNNLTTLNPEVINNPSVFGILADKYHKADKLGIKINLDIFMDLNEINMKIYEFTRIFGILLDNAIEASKECEEKIINVCIRFDQKRHKQLFIIENTYNNKDLDTLKIFDKNYTTKEGNSGLGLWQVNKIISKSKHIDIFTKKNEKFFSQQLEIYKK